GREEPHLDHFLNARVIRGAPDHLPVANMVDAAVADMRDPGVVSVEIDGDAGRAHPGAADPLGFGNDLLVGRHETGVEPAAWVGARRRLEDVADYLDRDLACDVAVPVATHPVGNDEDDADVRQPEFGVRVLVLLALPPEVSEADV